MIHYYKALQTSRVSSLVLGLLSINIVMAMLNLMINAIAGQGSSLSITWMILGLLILVLYVMSRKGPVVETTQNMEVTTYVKLGPFKLNRIAHGSGCAFQLQQDEQKYYCITIHRSDGSDFTLERFPTLDVATQHLTAMRQALGQKA